MRKCRESDHPAVVDANDADDDHDQGAPEARDEVQTRDPLRVLIVDARLQVDERQRRR